MNLIHNIVINGYSILLLTIIYAHSMKDAEKESLQFKLYITMLQVAMLLLVLDTFSRFDGNSNPIYPLLNGAGNFLIFLFNPIIPSIWFLYVHYQVYRDEERTKRFLIPLLLLEAIHVAMIVVSQFTGWIYSIDANNIYHRGPYYLGAVITTFILLLATFGLIAGHWREIERKHLFSLVFFAVPPIVGIILQINIYGISLVLNSVVLSLLIVLLNIQNHSMYTDFLTGIHNRKKFESYLKEKVSTSNESRTFSLVMLDLDNFKKINDTFGHDNGDISLRISTEVLQSCLRSKDFIARFGGDEFCLILDISDYKALEAAVTRINSYVDGFNASSSLPYKLCFSMGYAVYDFHSRLNAEEFLKQVDVLMYENKRMKKKQEE